MAQRSKSRDLIEGLIESGSLGKKYQLLKESEFASLKVYLRNHYDEFPNIIAMSHGGYFLINMAVVKEQEKTKAGINGKR